MSNSSNASATTERVGVEALPERPRRSTALRTIEGGLPEDEKQNAAAAADQAHAKVEHLQAWAQALDAKEKLIEQRVAGLSRVAALHEAAAKVLAIRSQLGVAMIFAFVLALLAMNWQSVSGLLVLVAWCCLTILPLGFLEWSGRRSR